MMYEKYNLKINPFADKTLDYPIINRVETASNVKKQLAGCIGSNNPAILPLVGEYGVGKTYFLRYMEDKILKGEFFGDGKEKLLAAYITAARPRLPTEYMHYFYSESMKRIGQRKFSTLVTELFSENRDGKAFKDFDQDFLHALKSYKKNQNLAWGYFRGDTLGRHEATEIEVKRSIRGDEQSLMGLVNLLKLLFVLDYDCMVFLIDEFEYLFARGSKGGAQYLNTFRFLYDRALERVSKEGDIASPIFVLACSVITWRDIVQDAEKQILGTKPFIDRSMDDITIPPFNSNETRAIIRDRLANWRISDKDKDRTGLFPFSDEKNDNPFEPIARISDGLPRRILKISALILDGAFDSDYRIIGAKEVETLAQSMGLERKQS